MALHLQASLFFEENFFSSLTHVSAVVRSKAGGFLAHEVLDNLKRFPQCLLLTKVGQFYEVSTFLIYISAAYSNSFVVLF